MNTELSIIIGVQHAQKNLSDILQNLNPTNYSNVEFLFCTTPDDPLTESTISAFNNCKAIHCKKGRLIPEMWGDGIEAANSNNVALTTAHCIPAKNWVDTLLQTDMTKYPGIGGVIENDAKSSARDWAIYFLRYISFAPPQQAREMHEIAADNAVYRRSDILENMDLMKKGFWEPSYHARFRKKGMAIALTPDLVVSHRNCYTTSQFFKQRLAHGKEFGLARVSQISTIRRVLLIVLSPALPILFLKKIITSINKQGAYKSKLPTALPWLFIFLLAWGLGEAKGYLSLSNK